jgi:hypothetical protein
MAFHALTVTVWTMGSIRASGAIHARLLSSMFSSTFRYVSIMMSNRQPLIVAYSQVAGSNASIPCDISFDSGRTVHGCRYPDAHELVHSFLHWFDHEDRCHLAICTPPFFPALGRHRSRRRRPGWLCLHEGTDGSQTRAGDCKGSGFTCTCRNHVRAGYVYDSLCLLTTVVHVTSFSIRSCLRLPGHVPPGIIQTE